MPRFVELDYHHAVLVTTAQAKRPLRFRIRRRKRLLSITDADAGARRRSKDLRCRRLALAMRESAFRD